jgi:hypothetical protein
VARRPDYGRLQKYSDPFVTPFTVLYQLFNFILELFAFAFQSFQSFLYLLSLSTVSGVL